MNRTPFEPLDAGLKRCCARGVFSESIMEQFAEWAREELAKPYHQVAAEYQRLHGMPEKEGAPPRTSRRAKRRRRGRNKAN